MSAQRLSPELRHAVPVFAALGDENRLRLVARLSGVEPQSITRLAQGATVTRQAVTKHLHVLAGAGLVRQFRSGREQLWELQTGPLEEARRSLELIAGQWDRALLRLKRSIEEETGER